MYPLPFSWLRLLICGICMGTADIIPGISGGTVAFIMGFYPDLIKSIKSLNKHAIGLLLTFQFKEFGKSIAWKFLLILMAGMGIAFVTLSKLIHFLLQHSLYKIYLYSFFLGLVLASTIFCAKQIKTWRLTHYLMTFSGILIAYFLTGNALQAQLILTEGFNWWIVFCGMIAISAMLLPGISGSYLLSILGVYPVVIASINTFLSDLKEGLFNKDAFMLLLSLFSGIVIGAILFSRVVAWLFTHYREMTIALLTGFMLGALRSVWPFENASETSSLTLFLALLCTMTGFGLVFLAEYLAAVEQEKELILN